MSSMTIRELYDKLNSKEFQENDNSLFYNYYIYQYPADKEYEMRAQLQDFKKNLVRPTSYIDVIMLDLFDTFCEYLDSQPFGNKYRSKLHYVLEKEKEEGKSQGVATMLTDNAHRREFLKYVHEKIIKLSEENQHLQHPYVFVCGIGKMYPYLRSNEFLTAYEEFNETQKNKIILFYPGHRDGNSFVLFDTLQDQHSYRSILLVNE